MTYATTLAAPGATPDDWAHFSLILGLTPDLLPVVSNREAKPAPTSKLKDIGKVPSVYVKDRQVVGIPKWTARTSTARDIDRWAAEPDYGICVQTRNVRALDVDITDEMTAFGVRNLIGSHLALPERCRANSPKVLLAFRLAGEHPKRVIRTAHGNIEFLGNGQQFVAVGTHPSGVRYEWPGGLPDDVPELTVAQFEALWGQLAKHFAVEPPVEGKAKKPDRLPEAIERDEVAQHLLRGDWVKSTERDGRLHIRCPFEHEHTTESSESATTYWPAHTGGYERGHFRCLHAHCEGRSDDEFRQAVGFDLFDFDTVEDDTSSGKRERFALLPIRELVAAVDSDYLIKHVLDRAALGIVYGESTAGKTFVALDWSFHIALGRAWRGKRVRQGRVVYICAEGLGGFKKRLAAFCQHHDVDDVPGMRVIADTPSLLRPADHKLIVERITAWGGADLIVVDTFARTMAGGDENSAETVMKALGHCDALHRATGAMVMLVAHSGKDQTKGVRGHSSIKPAADVQIEVLRDGEGAGTRRAVKLEKVKDGPDEGREFGFRLRTVTLGTDGDGDPITSCVVEPVDDQSSLKGKAKRIGKVESAVLELSMELAGLAGEAPTHDQVLDAYATKRAGADKKERKNAADAARRAIRGLEEIGKLRVEDGRVYLTD